MIKPTPSIALAALALALWAPAAHAAEVAHKAEPATASVRVRDVAVVGGAGLPTDRLIAVAAELKGQPFDEVALARVKSRIEALCAEAGYPLARVAKSRLDAQGTLQLELAAGRLQAIAIAGNQRTPETLIRRELSLRPGEVFTTERFEADRRRLWQLGLFDRIERSDSPGPVPDARNLQLTLSERPLTVGLGVVEVDPHGRIGAPYTFAVSALGYSTQRGILLGGSVANLNLAGSGQQLCAAFEGTQVTGLTLGQLAYYNPWLDSQRTGLGADLYTRRYNNFYGNFREEHASGRVLLSRPLFGAFAEPDWRGSLALGLDRASTFDNVYAGGMIKPDASVDHPITVSPTGTDWVFGPTLAASVDTRTPLAYGANVQMMQSPTDGYQLALEASPMLVNGRTPIVRATAGGSRYYPLPALPWVGDRQATLAFAAHAGFVGGVQVPAYERFFQVAGVTPADRYTYLSPFSIRGWPEVATPSSPFGRYPQTFYQGNQAVVASAEYRFPIYHIVSGALFGDTGMFWDDRFSLGLLHSGYGGGLRLDTPVGPVRLDFATNGIDDPVFDFAIGQKF